MADREQHTPGPARGAQARKDEEEWTLILVRQLRHSPGKVWQSLTDPAHLREWAPFEVDGNPAAGTTVNLGWVGTPTPLATTVTRADAPKLLEYNDIRWELEAFGGGTRLMLWRAIDRPFILWDAAGWHISFDVLERLLAGEPNVRIVGADNMKFGWQRLNAEYATRFDISKRSTWSYRRLKVVNRGDEARVGLSVRLCAGFTSSLAFPILGYIYSMFEEIPKCAARVRFVVVPVMLHSAFWMWKGHVL